MRSRRRLLPHVRTRWRKVDTHTQKRVIPLIVRFMAEPEHNLQQLHQLLSLKICEVIER
jgi:hypothetical protein